MFFIDFQHFFDNRVECYHFVLNILCVTIFVMSILNALYVNREPAMRIIQYKVYT